MIETRIEPTSWPPTTWAVNLFWGAGPLAFWQQIVRGSREEAECAAFNLALRFCQQHSGAPYHE